MKIIKEGDLARVTSTRRFECERCGAIWEADASEYRVECDFRNGHYCVMACPTCRRDVIVYPDEDATR